VLRTKVYFNIQEKRIQHQLVKTDLGNAWRVWVGEWRMGGQQLVFCSPYGEAWNGFFWPCFCKAGVGLQLLSLLVQGWPMEPQVQLTSAHSSWCSDQVSSLMTQDLLLVCCREGKGKSLQLQYW